jgi:hypothetical protein
MISTSATSQNWKKKTLQQTQPVVLLVAIALYFQ